MTFRSTEHVLLFGVSLFLAAGAHGKEVFPNDSCTQTVLHEVATETQPIEAGLNGKGERVDAGQAKQWETLDTWSFARRVATCFITPDENENFGLLVSPELAAQNKRAIAAKWNEVSPELKGENERPECNEGEFIAFVHRVLWEPEYLVVEDLKKKSEFTRKFALGSAIAKRFDLSAAIDKAAAYVKRICH